MAITGIDTIEGKQIIAAGAVSAKSAEMAYNDENGNPITGYQPAGDYLTTADSANFYTTANESGFITGVDLTPYMLTANMTAYQSAGSYLSSTDSANFYTTANESGFITGVGDTYLQNTDLTISDGKITEISGVPLSAGDELPESVSAATDYITATSANIDSTINNVSANSGVWGGSALPISAGPGIKFEMVDNTLVASTDETVLASGIANDATAFTLSEPAGNFEKIRLIGTYNTCTEVFGNNSRMSWTTDFVSESDGVRRNRCYCVSSTDGIHWYEVKVYGYDQSNYTTISPNGGTGWYLETQKIVGLIRTAGE